MNRISSEELSEWAVFYQYEPFGTEVDLYGHAGTQAVMINLLRSKKSKAVEVKDLMPKFRPNVSERAPSEAMGFASTVHALLKSEGRSD